MSLEIREYSTGVCEDGIVILCDGHPLTPEQITSRLRVLEEVRKIAFESVELNMQNYTHDEVDKLDESMADIWSCIYNQPQRP